mgnify:CR=1 FL=1
MILHEITLYRLVSWEVRFPGGSHICRGNGWSGQCYGFTSYYPKSQRKETTVLINRNFGNYSQLHYNIKHFTGKGLIIFVHYLSTYPEYAYKMVLCNKQRHPKYTSSQLSPASLSFRCKNSSFSLSLCLNTGSIDRPCYSWVSARFTDMWTFYKSLWLWLCYDIQIFDGYAYVWFHCKMLIF